MKKDEMEKRSYQFDVRTEKRKNAFNYISYNCILRSNNAYDVFCRGYVLFPCHA